MKGILTTLLIAAGFTAAALAQEAAQGMLPKFADVDENEDGKIDAAEAKVLAESLEESELKFDFTTADANEDGAVDAAEYAKYQEELMS